MKVCVSLPINSTKEAVWDVITDIENSKENIRAINKIEIINKPVDGIKDLKWRETRTMFGKEATEVMWITDYETNKYYKTRAESHGMIYISSLEIKENNNNVTLYMRFEGVATSFGGRIMSTIFGGMMKKSTEKALLVDLEDIKRVVESRRTD